MANKWKSKSGQDFEKWTQAMKKKAEEMKKGEGFDKDWHKKYSQKRTGGSFWNKPNQWFNNFTYGSDDDKKKMMRNLFLGFGALFVIKLLLGGLGGGRQRDPYDPFGRQ